jgi:hypothetical protein
MKKSTNRFIMQPSESKPNHWVCTDTVNMLMCIFENGKFNETQEFTLFEDVKNPDANVLAKACNEMAEWLRSNHYKKAMP